MGGGKGYIRSKNVAEYFRRKGGSILLKVLVRRSILFLGLGSLLYRLWLFSGIIYADFHSMLFRSKVLDLNLLLEHSPIIGQYF